MLNLYKGYIVEFSMKTREAIAQRILNLCKEKDITPNKLGTISGVEPSTITSIFYGKSKNPGIVTIKSICDGLEITLFDFFNDDLFKTLDLDDQKKTMPTLTLYKFSNEISQNSQKTLKNTNRIEDNTNSDYLISE